MTDSNVIDKVSLVYGQMNKPPGNRLRVALTGLTMAEKFRDEGRNILLFVDNIYRYTLASTEYPHCWAVCLSGRHRRPWRRDGRLQERSPPPKPVLSPPYRPYTYLRMT
ncbi:hypothetical protein ACNKHU_23470 [Shigella flexneri]